MEDLPLIILILGVYIPSFIGALWVLKRPKTGKKRAVDTSGDTVSEMFDTTSRGYKEIIKVKDNQVRSLASKLKLNQDEETVDQQGLLDQEPTWEDVKAFAKAEGINPLYLEIPMVKKEVKKLIKGMSIQEIQENVGELKKLAESKGFKFGTKTDGSTEDPVAQLLKQNPDAFH